MPLSGLSRHPLRCRPDRRSSGSRGRAVGGADEPSFSVMANVGGRMAAAALRHVASALARLAPGGRLVTITGANFSPEAPAWHDAFIRLQDRGRVVFTVVIEGQVPRRPPVSLPKVSAPASLMAPKTARGSLASAAAPRPIAPLAQDPEGEELVYDTVDWMPPEGAPVGCHLRGMRAAIVAHPRRCAASDLAGAIRRHGLGHAAKAILPAHAAR